MSEVKENVVRPSVIVLSVVAPVFYEFVNTSTLQFEQKTYTQLTTIGLTFIPIHLKEACTVLDTIILFVYEVERSSFMLINCR